MEHELMNLLQERLESDDIRQDLERIAAELLAELRDPENLSKSTFRSIPLSFYGEDLPDAVGSSWVFALRRGMAHPPERHPNSVQRMFALTGPGYFEWWDKDHWDTRLLVPGGIGLSIPADAWHRMPAQQHDWAVVSFHTVGADELEEIVGDPESGEVESTRIYLAGSETESDT